MLPGEFPSKNPAAGRMSQARRSKPTRGASEDGAFAAISLVRGGPYRRSRLETQQSQACNLLCPCHMLCTPHSSIAHGKFEPALAVVSSHIIITRLLASLQVFPPIGFPNSQTCHLQPAGYASEIKVRGRDPSMEANRHINVGNPPRGIEYCAAYPNRLR